MNRARQVTAILVACVLAGCAAKATPPVATAQATATPQATATVPLPTMVPAGADGQLVSQQIATSVTIDGEIDDAWALAQPLRVPLTWGADSTEHALDVELRALHTDTSISFLAQWPGEAPSGEANTTSNKLTLHWRIPEPAAQGLDCTVVCHTAFADGNGRFAYANTETIPQGGSKPLESAGKWENGTWTLEWSRPLASDNPFDLQLVEQDQSYTFRVKVFERIEGWPDPVSGRHLLVFP